MSKKFKGQRCPYCSEREAVTGDHIFAREFFLPSARANLPQAPTCDKCNNEKSKLEHYLTTVLPFGGRHADASVNLASMVPKRLGKNVRLHRRLIAGQQIVSAPDKEGKFEETIAIPFEGEKLEQLFSMIVRGLVWHHWRVYLADGYAVQTHTVTTHGLHLCENLLFRPNARDRVQGNHGNGTFIYEGAQAIDDPGITVWKFAVYGGLASYEDLPAPESLGSHLISMTGPLAAFARVNREA
ncbi:MAG: HNH endonuclease [Terriglobia bacterium]